MVAQRTDNRTPQSQPTRQRSLFGPDLPSTLQVAGPEVPCDVVPIEKGTQLSVFEKPAPRLNTRFRLHGKP
jgi:hypothetical protein